MKSRVENIFKRKQGILLKDGDKKILTEGQNQSGGKEFQQQIKTDGYRSESYSSKQSSRDAPTFTWQVWGA